MTSQGRAFRLLLLLCASWCRAETTLIPYDPGMQYPMSPAAAAAAARSWAKDPTLELALVGVYHNQDEYQDDCYVLKSPGRQQFEVDCYTGVVSRWLNLPAMEAYQARLDQGSVDRLPQEQLDRAATEFAQARYPNYGVLAMQKRALETDEPPAGQVDFWTRLPTGGWFSGNQCSIRIDSFTGTVWGYHALIHGPVTISLQPALTAEQAETAAFAYFGAKPEFATAFASRPSELDVLVDVLGQQRLVWLVFAMVSDDPSITLAGLEAGEIVDGTLLRMDTLIDALTGEVIDVIDYLGTGAPMLGQRASWRPRLCVLRQTSTATRKPVQRLPDRSVATVVVGGRRLGGLHYPPIPRMQTTYWYIGYLRSPLWQMGVSYLAGRATVVAADGRKAVIDTRSGEVSIDGVRVAGKHRPLVMKGRLYLPLALWARLTGSRFEWVAAKQTLVIHLARGEAHQPGHL